MRYPFEVLYEEIEANPDLFVNAVFASLESSFLLLPRGRGFVAYADFQDAYEALKRRTIGFTVVDLKAVVDAIEEDALAFVVLRTILGFTPPELADVTSQESGVTVSQSFARDLDREVRVARRTFQSVSSTRRERVQAMVAVACRLLREGVGDVPESIIHRLDKVDTRSGLSDLRHLASEGVPYAMLLYERFLGRPFAGHRDAVSELVGEVMENAVEERLRKAGISFRKTKRVERIAGFDQAPDFIVPDEWNPHVVIEAKIIPTGHTDRALAEVSFGQ